MKALGPILLLSVICLFHFALWYFVLTHMFFSRDVAASAAGIATVIVALVVGVRLRKRASG